LVNGIDLEVGENRIDLVEAFKYFKIIKTIIQF
jgi:hypothetical protein